jgi:hypothetical protein
MRVGRFANSPLIFLIYKLDYTPLHLFSSLTLDPLDACNQIQTEPHLTLILDVVGF